MMTGMVWLRESLVAGDHVKIDVHPARNGRPYGFLESIVKGDGSVLPTSFDAVTGEAKGKAPPTIQAATSLNGIWKVDSTTVERYAGGSEGYYNARLELTEKARVAQSVYDEESEQRPVSQCIGVPEPYMTVLAHHISARD
jgi:hypothetical protein